jgi:hypothetical protein
MKGDRASELRFRADFARFLPPDQTYTNRLIELLEADPNVRVDRFALARTLESEVLSPWRATAQPLLQGPAVPDADSPSARLQVAVRDYLRAKDRALTLTVQSLRAGDAESSQAADQARAELAIAAQRLNGIE